MMKVERLITRTLVTLPSGVTLLEAAKQMAQSNIGLLVICDAKDKTRVLGVVSERDMIRSIAAGENLTTQVDKISTQNVVTVSANSEVAEAAKAMNKHRIRHVVVVDGQNRPVGVVSMRDLVAERVTLSAILQSHEKEIFVGGD